MISCGSGLQPGPSRRCSGGEALSGGFQIQISRYFRVFNHLFAQQSNPI
jgi:hypothetical protein